MSLLRKVLCLCLFASTLSLVACSPRADAPGEASAPAEASGTVTQVSDAPAATVEVLSREDAAVSGEAWQARVAFDAAGHRREAMLFFPAGNDGQRSLLILFHGLGDSAQSFANGVGAQAAASKLGVIIAVPEGLPNPGDGARAWNAGACCAFGAEERDDAAIVPALKAAVASLSAFDQETVDVAGFSNGGFFSEYLACEHSEWIRGAMNVGGSRPLPAGECNPSTPVKMVRVHGVSDTRVPFEGGEWRGGTLPSFEESFVEWRTLIGCSRAPTPASQGAAACRLQADCPKGELLACSVQDLGHAWPQRRSSGVDVLEMAWQVWQGSVQP